MTTETTVYQGDEKLRAMLREEAAATAKYLEYKKTAEEWEKWRNGKRAAIAALTGNAPIVKIGDLVVATRTVKDQFAGKRFADEYPTLAEEFTRVRSVAELDVDALREAHPDLVAKFSTVTFTNKVD